MMTPGILSGVVTVQVRLTQALPFLFACQPSTPSYPPAGQTRYSEITVGLDFDSHGLPNEKSPILFSRFHWRDGKLACRVPLSTAALLEANACNFEIQASLLHMQDLTKDVILVEEKLLDKKWFEYLYNPELGVYSIAVHLVANFLDTKSIQIAFQYASALASIALNIPSDCFDLIKVPDYLKVFGERNSSFLKSHNYGYAYFALICHSEKWKDGQEISDWLEITLSRAGLPPLAKLEEKVLNEMQMISDSVYLTQQYASRFKLLEQIGNENFALLGLHPTINDVLKNFDKLQICPIVTGDAEWKFLGKMSALHQEKNCEDWYNTVSDCYSRLKNFYDACR